MITEDHILERGKDKLLTKADALLIFATKENISEAKADMLKWIIVLFSPFYVCLIAFLIKYFFRA